MGTIKVYGLWDFWESIPIEKQNDILKVLKTEDLYSLYNELFNKDEVQQNIGPIGVLRNLLVIFDIELCTLVFSKFITYSLESYTEKTEWNDKWNKIRNSMQERALYYDEFRLKKGLVVDENHSHVSTKNYLTRKTLIDLFWSDTFFFLNTYSKIVYKLFLDGKAGIDLLEKAVNFSLKNHKELYLGVNNSLEDNMGNYPIHQYLIYLEKQKLFDECLNLMDTATLIGWTNDFESRRERVMRKISKLKQQ